MGIGERIAKLRMNSVPRLTQDGLAKKIGISRAALSHYEKDRREPDFETLEKIADYYEVSTDFLLGRTKSGDKGIFDDQADKSYFISKIASEFPDIELMFKDMESLSAEDLREVYDYIKFKKSQKDS